MPDYRIYCLDAAGNISFADWIIARDDDAAIEQARKLKHHGRICEVWHRTELVATLGAHDLAN